MPFAVIRARVVREHDVAIGERGVPNVAPPMSGTPAASPYVQPASDGSVVHAFAAFVTVKVPLEVVIA